MTKVISFLTPKRFVFVVLQVICWCCNALGDSDMSRERQVVRVVEGRIYLPSDDRRKLVVYRALLPEIAKQNSRGAFLRRVSLQHTDSSTSVIHAAYMDVRGAWSSETLTLDIVNPAIRMELRQARGSNVTSDGRTYIPLANGATVVDELEPEGNIEATSIIPRSGVLAISSVRRDLRTFVFVNSSTWKTMSSASIPNREQEPDKLLIVNQSVVGCQWSGRKIEGVYIVDLSKRRVVKDTEHSWIRATKEVVEVVEDPDENLTTKLGRSRFLSVLFTQKR